MLALQQVLKNAGRCFPVAVFLLWSGSASAQEAVPAVAPTDEVRFDEIVDLVEGTIVAESTVLEGPVAGFDIAALEEFQAEQKAVAEAELVAQKKDDAAKAKDDEAKEDGDTSAPAPAAVPTDPDVVTLTLADGSKITGKLTINEIKLTTSFGDLTIPVTRVVSFAPGLDSRAELAQKVTGFIEKMADAQYSNREQAEKALLAMGPGVREEIKRHLDDKNAEKVKNLKSLLDKLNELAADEEEMSKGAKSLSRQDMVVTPSFTAAGRISPEQFEVVSKFGKLTVKLADIQSLERPMQRESEIFKTVKVDGNQHIVQKGTLNTRIQIEKGDRVTIKADGQISMTPWGTEYTSGPDGDGNQYGWYDQSAGIPGGALLGKLGTSDKPFKIGSSHTFTAKKSGALYLAIGIHPGQSGSPFPGTYNVKVRVERK